jgi:hypothetical protein
MADKQIGIKVDLKQTGLKPAEEALNSISKNLNEISKNESNQPSKGWGSEAQTKELREQLRYMQEMLQLSERIARTKGGSATSEPSQGANAPSGGSASPGPGAGSNAGSGAGSGGGSGTPRAESPWNKGAKWVGRIGVGAVAYGLTNMIKSGLSTGDQLAYGFGDLSKGMDPSANPVSYRNNLLKQTRGFGYNDAELLQSSSQYGAVTGAMNPTEFNSQLQTMAKTGRDYGMSSPPTELFSSMYQGGVTGGSQAQMSPQEFAKIFANAIDQGKMAGKTEQVSSQLQQLVQMGSVTSGNAGDLKTMSAFLAMGNKSGNQAFMNNLPTTMEQISNGIASPGGSYAGEAMMMQAIGGGKMDISETLLQMSKGAFNKNDKTGKTNIEASLEYITSQTEGMTTAQKSVTLGDWLHLNYGTAEQVLNNYTTSDGKFDEEGIKKIVNDSRKSPKPILPNVIDESRNRSLELPSTTYDIAANTLEGRSYADQVKAKALDAVGVPLAYGSQLGSGVIGSAATIGATWLAKKWKSRGGIDPVPSGGSPPGDLTPTETPPGDLPPRPRGGGFLNRLGKFATKAGKFLGPVGTAASLYESVNAGDYLGDYTFGHTKGTPKIGWNPFSHETWQDDRDPIWKRTEKSSSDEARMQGDAQEQYQVGVQSNGVQSTNNPSGGAIQGLTGAALAPLVASTIVALGPFMGQIKATLGVGSGAGSFSDLVYRGEGSQTNNLLYRPESMSPGIQLANYTGNNSANNPGNKYGGWDLGSPSGTIDGSKPGNNSGNSTPKLSGNVSDFVKNMLPYAKQAADQTGLPQEFILGQWGHETGWGKETTDSGGPSVSKMNNNFAGIKPWHNSKGGADAGPNSMYAGYDSPSDFANGYADFLKSNGRYDDLLKASKNGASDDELANIMGHTGYAEDKGYTDKLNGAINAAQNAIKVIGEVTVNVKQPDGSTDVVKVTLSPSYPNTLRGVS